MPLQSGVHKYPWPVFTGVGLSVTANSLAVMKKLVFEDKVTTMAEIIDALNHNWEGYEELRAKAACSLCIFCAVKRLITPCFTIKEN